MSSLSVLSVLHTSEILYRHFLVFRLDDKGKNKYISTSFCCCYLQKYNQNFNNLSYFGDIFIVAMGFCHFRSNLYISLSFSLSLFLPSTSNSCCQNLKKIIKILEKTRRNLVDSRNDILSKIISIIIYVVVVVLFW